MCPHRRRPTDARATRRTHRRSLGFIFHAGGWEGGVSVSSRGFKSEGISAAHKCDTGGGVQCGYWPGSGPPDWRRRAGHRFWRSQHVGRWREQRRVCCEHHGAGGCAGELRRGAGCRRSRGHARISWKLSSRRRRCQAWRRQRHPHVQLNRIHKERHSTARTRYRRTGRARENCAASAGPRCGALAQGRLRRRGPIGLLLPGFRDPLLCHWHGV
jgi:hypothetical protein